MPGKKSYIMGYGDKAREWEFPIDYLTWKIIYNPLCDNIPECITVFTRNKDKHKEVQNDLDKFLTRTMGRGGNNLFARGGGELPRHDALHKWIEEPTGDADINTHDHFIISVPNDTEALNSADTIRKVVLQLIVIGHVKGAPDEPVQYLSKGL